MEGLKVLVVGAGALGCEILSKLALSGFKDIEVVDFDTIETSNLCRQFLFTSNDVGLAKAEVAAQRISSLGLRIKCQAHLSRIELLPLKFLHQFNIVFCALDNVDSRLWLNEALCTLPAGSILLVEAGTEGFMGHVRGVLPGETACLYCTKYLYPPHLTRPLCSVAGSPKDVEDCIAWAIMIEWPRHHASHQFNPEEETHLDAALSLARARASTYSLGLVTRESILAFLDAAIPAIISTTSVIAGISVLIAQQACAVSVNLADGDQANYWFFNGKAGAFLSSQRLAFDPSCPICRPGRGGSEGGKPLKAFPDQRD